MSLVETFSPEAIKYLRHLSGLPPESPELLSLPSYLSMGRTLYIASDAFLISRRLSPNTIGFAVIDETGYTKYRGPVYYAPNLRDTLVASALRQFVDEILAQCPSNPVPIFGM